MKRLNLKSLHYDYTYTIDIISKKRKGKLFAFYFLDGQNVFKDKYAAYHKSLRAKKLLDSAKINYIAIAIHSPNSLLRFDNYTPFKLKQFNNDINFYKSFIKDMNELIIPTIEENLEVESRSLITSSLATIPALNLADSFDNIALFSSAYFLGYEECLKLIHKTDTYYFLAVGKKEYGDEVCTPKDYLESSNWIKDKLDKLNIKNDLYIDDEGVHDELSWSRYLNIFINNIKEE